MLCHLLHSCDYLPLVVWQNDLIVRYLLHDSIGNVLTKTLEEESGENKGGGKWREKLVKQLQHLRHCSLRDCSLRDCSLRDWYTVLDWCILGHSQERRETDQRERLIHSSLCVQAGILCVLYLPKYIPLQTQQHTYHSTYIACIPTTHTQYTYTYLSTYAYLLHTPLHIHSVHTYYTHSIHTHTSPHTHTYYTHLSTYIACIPTTHTQ